jgi:peptidyl-prolyl cis-trans isomerase SurA
MRHLLPCVVGALLFASGLSAQTVVDEIVAKVNSDIILKSDLDRQLEILRADLQAQGVPAPDLASTMGTLTPNILRDLIDEHLLVQKAAEYGLETEANLQVLRTMDSIREQNGFETIEDLEEAILNQGDTPEGIRESIRRQYLSEQVLNYEVRSRVIATTDELREYYDAHLADFDRPRGVNLAEIAKVVGGRTRAEAEEIRAEMEAILARVRDGEDFFQIALEESESTTAPAGGVLGYFEDGMLGPEFEEAASTLERNQISDIFEVGDALVIIRLLERHDGGILSFESARTEIDNIVSQEKAVPRIREYLTRLRRDGFVEVREGYVDTGAGDDVDVAEPL